MELQNFQLAAVLGSLLLLGLWIEPWAQLARWLEVRYEATLLVAGAMALCIGMILYLTVVISSLMRQNLVLAREIAVLLERGEAAMPGAADR